MEFPTPAVQKCYERIAPMVKEVFGDFAWPFPNDPAFSVAIGSAYVTIKVNPWTDDDAVVPTYAWVVTGAETTPDLMRHLLTENFDLRFGAFGMDQAGDIILQHSIAGATCDKEDLRASAMAIVHYADASDDEIVAKFGGQRAIDRGPAQTAAETPSGVPAP